MILKTIHNVEFSGKRVLLRASLNVPVNEDGSVADVYRLKAVIPTLEYLASRGAKIGILAHLGRQGDSLGKVAQTLATMTAVPISFFDGAFEEAPGVLQECKEGSAVVFENVRRDEREEKNDEQFAKILASIGEIFVQDAFADAHRAHASVLGIAKLLPSYAGLLIEREVGRLLLAITPPKGSLGIVGGAKFETKQPLIEKLLPVYDRICVGGALANDFLRARGFETGTSLISKVPVPPELARDSRILVEQDVFVVRDEYKRIAQYQNVRPTERIVDAGPETAALWSEKIQEVPFVLWNGPVGIYEEGYTTGTDALARALAQSSAKACVGGGDTIAALSKFSFDADRVFCSTGGGAMLQFLADGTLPGLEPLRSKN